MSLIEWLIDLICLPYELWKRSNESSGVGLSESERKAQRFWGWFAAVAAVVILGAGLLVWGVFGR